MDDREEPETDRVGPEPDDAVDPATADADDESASVKTYECDQCGNRVEASHQPMECEVCGGEMIDISVTRE